MITDRAAYERWCEAERWERLQRMSIDESIALGIATPRPPQARGSTS